MLRSPVGSDRRDKNSWSVYTGLRVQNDWFSAVVLWGRTVVGVGALTSSPPCPLRRAAAWVSPSKYGSDDAALRSVPGAAPHV